MKYKTMDRAQWRRVTSRRVTANELTKHGVQGKESFIQMAKTYFAGGGQQYTVSVVSQEELLDAQKNPDAHRDLIVRVGGYSDYFVNLEKGLQDNVIKRSTL